MPLSADEILEEVGSFGWFQKRLLILFNLLSALLFGWAVMVTGIITAEPPWKCAQNSSVCVFDEAISPGDDDYEHRCNISRSEWEFVDDMTTVVTEVREGTMIYICVTELKVLLHKGIFLQHTHNARIMFKEIARSSLCTLAYNVLC